MEWRLLEFRFFLRSRISSGFGHFCNLPTSAVFLRHWKCKTGFYIWNTTKELRSTVSFRMKNEPILKSVKSKIQIWKRLFGANSLWIISMALARKPSQFLEYFINNSKMSSTHICCSLKYICEFYCTGIKIKQMFRPCFCKFWPKIHDMNKAGFDLCIPSRLAWLKHEIVTWQASLKMRSCTYFRLQQAVEKAKVTLPAYVLLNNVEKAVCVNLLNGS